MATANLFLVTQTLTRLLDLNVRNLLVRNGFPANLSVSAMPPERVGSEANTLNLHLYHLVEDAHFRNDPPPGAGVPPVAFQPLGLSLFYILTAHHHVNEVFDAETQQLLFGLGMKTFHDFPQVRDDLMIPPGNGIPEQVMPGGLVGRDNRFDIALRPLTAEEAMGFWHADDSATTRLSAYYEVRPVFLEPEPVTAARGLVFDLGVYLSAGMAPRIEGSNALVQFTPPLATGMAAQALVMSPARATLGAGLPEGPVNRITLTGQRLSGGGAARARIQLRADHWRARVPPVLWAEVDPDLNPAWAVHLDAATAQFDMQAGLDVADAGGPPVTLPILPGLYGVSISVEQAIDLPSGTRRTSRKDSNRTVISLGARLLSADPPDGNGRIRLNVANLFDMLGADIDAQLAIDGLMYDEVPAFSGVPADDRGHFRRLAGAVEFQPLFALVAGEAHPIRLVINGAESQPFWVVIP